jgi:hypothetical protein
MIKLNRAHAQSRVTNSRNGNIDEYYPRKMHWQKLPLFNVVVVAVAVVVVVVKASCDRTLKRTVNKGLTIL